MDERAFRDYLENEAHLSAVTCNNYAQRILNIEQFAREQGYVQTRMYGQTEQAVQQLQDMLFRDPAFYARYTPNAQNQFKAAVKKLLAAMDGGHVTRGQNIAPASQMRTSAEAAAPTVQNVRYRSIDEAHFRDYLSNVARLSAVSCNNYAQGIVRLEKFAQSQGYPQTQLYGRTYAEVQSLANMIFRDAAFNERFPNTLYQNQMRAAVRKLLEALR